MVSQKGKEAFNISLDRWYICQKNDTFAIIASKLYITVAQIESRNPTVNVNNVYEGLKLVVPLPQMNYTVIQGETFASIAIKFNTNSATIQELNPTASPNNVYGGLVLKVPRPVGDFQILTKEQFEWQALLCTSQYETSRKFPESFGVTSGNHDGAAVSWGAIQFNAKTGPLISMWQAMINNHATVAMKAFTDNTSRTNESNLANYESWKTLFLAGNFADILAWADPRSDVTKDKHALIEPWNTYFMNLGITPEAQELQKTNAAWYHQIALQWFNDFGLWSRQGYALMFDIAVQSGSMNPKVDGVTYDLIGEINTWYAGISKTGKTAAQLEVEKLVKIANRRADYIASSWQASYRDRKVTLAEGYGEVYGMIMDTDTMYNMGLEPMYIENVPGELWYPLQEITTNTAPAAVGDNYVTDEDTTLTVEAVNGLLKNDTDPEGNPLTAILVSSPTYGTLDLKPDGGFTYIPNKNYNGNDFFTYKATDGLLDSPNASVQITINAVTDPQPTNTDVYIVKAGDAFSLIAQSYGITTAELSALNPDVDPDLIYVGQELYVPRPDYDPPEEPTFIRTIADSTEVSAIVTDNNGLTVKLIVEASLKADFTSFVETKESAFVESGSRVYIWLDSLDFNTIESIIYLRVRANNGSHDSPVKELNYTYTIPQPTNTQIYTVLAGETLSSISIKFNTTVSKLLELNPFVEAVNVYQGQQMYVPTYIAPEPPPDIGPLPIGYYPLEGSKTDWKPTDYLDFEQMNRMESTIQILKDAAQAYGNVSFSFEILTARTETHIEWADSFNRIEEGILTIAKFFNLENSIETPKTDWKALQSVSYIDMNRIENNILDIYKFVHGNLSLVKYCGQTIVGDEGVA
jgi:LysM repeat protein